MRQPEKNSIGAKKLIFLIGMPAAGKTWWGNKLSCEYNLSFTDLDAYIEEQEGLTIGSLFATYGEDGFRKKENKYLRQAISITPAPAIIACGGGTPCFNDNMGIMKETGIVIYLNAGIPYLLDNIEKSKDIRPLLSNNPDIAVYLPDLLTDRKKFYEAADIILDVENISLVTFDEIISSCIKRP